MGENGVSSRVRLVYLIYFAAAGSVMPFQVLFLQRNGLSPTAIGLLGSIAAGVAIVPGLLWVSWSDKLHSRKPFLLFGFATQMVTWLIFPLASEFYQFLMLMVAMSMLIPPLEALMNVWVLGKVDRKSYRISIFELTPHPFALFECKRVGVEEGVKKGPQTIEKAKQGAYVARTVSSLQKIRMSDGSVFGILHLDTGDLRCEPYLQFLQEVIASDDPVLLRDFTLTVGVVSNHGNWFTSDDHNKELKVLAQSYDWLLFLSDSGLSDFVERLLINPRAPYTTIKKAFAESYTGRKGANRFTKVRIDLGADLALQEFFSKNLSSVEQWFNVISPAGRSIAELKRELSLLASKKWKEILA